MYKLLLLLPVTVLISAFILASPLAAIQTDTDTLQVRLDEVRVEAARITETGKSAPFAVSIRNRTASQAQAEPPHPRPHHV
ncbi:MAG: hypothetical protein LC662_12680 [Rhodothermaceae bacterium]|nr:hypothetical protein [Rhodothermaceae bacterium]